MRLFSVLLLIFSLLLVSSAFAAQKTGVKKPATAPTTPTERVYLDVEVNFDPIEQTASDQDGFPISGSIQSLYPNGRLAWETQWVEGKLHGVTRGYYENRKLMEETTWVNGKMHGPARWYDEKGNLRRETMYEDDKDLSAPAGQDEAQDQSADGDKTPQEAPAADGDKAPEESPSAKADEGAAKQ
jgi:hypothetical protein